MSDPEGEPGGEPEKDRGGVAAMRLIGGLLIAMGGLIAATCGYLTAQMWSTCATVPGSPGPFAILGGIPTLLGALMVVAGVILIVVAQRKPPASGDFE